MHVHFHIKNLSPIKKTGRTDVETLKVILDGHTDPARGGCRRKGRLRVIGILWHKGHSVKINLMLHPVIDYIHVSFLETMGRNICMLKCLEFSVERMGSGATMCMPGVQRGECR